MSADVNAAISDAFREVLGVTEIDPDVSFIDMGGVSIEAAQIAALVNEALQVDLSAADVLGRETLRQIASLAEERLLAVEAS